MSPLPSSNRLPGSGTLLAMGAEIAHFEPPDPFGWMPLRPLPIISNWVSGTAESAKVPLNVQLNDPLPAKSSASPDVFAVPQSQPAVPGDDVGHPRLPLLLIFAPSTKLQLGTAGAVSMLKSALEPVPKICSAKVFSVADVAWVFEPLNVNVYVWLLTLAFRSAVKLMPPTESVWMVSAKDGTEIPTSANSKRLAMVLSFKRAPLQPTAFIEQLPSQRSTGPDRRPMAKPFLLIMFAGSFQYGQRCSLLESAIICTSMHLNSPRLAVVVCRIRIKFRYFTPIRNRVPFSKSRSRRNKMRFGVSN